MSATIARSSFGVEGRAHGAMAECEPDESSETDDIHHPPKLSVYCNAMIPKRDIANLGLPRTLSLGTLPTWVWMTAAYVASVAIAILAVLLVGTGHAGAIAGLKLTGRLSFCIFLPAYIGGSLRTLFGPYFQDLARRGRDFGLAFASAHVTHVCLIVYLYRISTRSPVSTSTAIIFGVALALTYLLALFSIPAMGARRPAWLWWSLRTIGMDYIAFVFLLDFFRDPFDFSISHIIAYVPFAAFGACAALLRITAYGVRLQRRWLSAAVS